MEIWTKSNKNHTLQYLHSRGTNAKPNDSKQIEMHILEYKKIFSFKFNAFLLAHSKW